MLYKLQHPLRKILILWVVVVDGETVTGSGVTVDLSAGGMTDVHERLWSATHLRMGARPV